MRYRIGQYWPVARRGLTFAVLFQVLLSTLSGSVRADDKAACFNGPEVDKVVACQRVIATGGLLAIDLAKAYNNLGIGHSAQNSWEPAAEAFTNALRLLPSFEPAIANRAMLFRDKGNTEFALKELDRAIAINGRYAFAFYHRAITHKLRGDLDKAIADFDRVLALRPGDKAATEGRRQVMAALAERDRSKPVARQAATTTPQANAADPILTAPKVTAAMLRAHLLPRLLQLPQVKAVEPIAEGVLKIVTTDGRTIEMGLQNLLDGLNQDPSSRPTRIAEALGLIGGSVARAMPDQQTKEAFLAALMPVIKNRSFVDEVAKRTGTTARPLLHRPLAGDIVVVVGFDEPKGIRMLQMDDGKIHGVDDAAMFEQANKNLKKRLSSLKLVESGAIKIVDFDTSYNVSLLVIDEIWSAVAPGAEDDVVVALPSRDALIIGSAKDPASVGGLRRIVAMPNQAYPISTQLLRRQGKGWVVLE